MMAGQDQREKGVAASLPGSGVWLVVLRYALPLLIAAILLVLGLFHNVYVSQGGQEVEVSLLPLWFNTLKASRTYLLNGDTVTGGRAFYTVLVFCAVVAALLFVISLCASVFGFYTLRRVARARALGDREGEKEAKILFRAFLPNRAWLTVANLLVLPLALFPEIFSLVCGRFLTASRGGALYIRFNVTAFVTLVLLLALLVLAVLERRASRAVGLDLFFVDDEDSDCHGNEEDRAE